MNDNIFENIQQVDLDIFIDGLTASKSSKWEIWPVMGSLVGKTPMYHNFHLYDRLKKIYDIFDYLKDMKNS